MFLDLSQLNIISTISEMKTFVIHKGPSQVKKSKVKYKAPGTMIN